MRIVNKKARYDYEILDKVEAGIVLTGAEVKSIKLGRVRLDDSFVRVDSKDEIWLVNCNISPYSFADNRNYDPTRSRKLLMHKKEILSLLKKMESKNLTLIPISCYTRGRKIKIEVGLVKGRKKWQKKEKIKRRDLDREQERELRLKRY